jgi:hypothetical protein
LANNTTNGADSPFMKLAEPLAAVKRRGKTQVAPASAQRRVLDLARRYLAQLRPEAWSKRAMPNQVGLAASITSRVVLRYSLSHSYVVVYIGLQ